MNSTHLRIPARTYVHVLDARAHAYARARTRRAARIYAKTMLEDVESRQPVGPRLIGDSVTAYLQPTYLPVHVIATLLHIYLRSREQDAWEPREKPYDSLSFFLFFLSSLGNRSFFFFTLATRWRYVRYGLFPNCYS